MSFIFQPYQYHPCEHCSTASSQTTDRYPQRVTSSRGPAKASTRYVLPYRNDLIDAYGPGAPSIDDEIAAELSRREILQQYNRYLEQERDNARRKAEVHQRRLAEQRRAAYIEYLKECRAREERAQAARAARTEARARRERELLNRLREEYRTLHDRAMVDPFNSSVQTFYPLTLSFVQSGDNQSEDEADEQDQLDVAETETNALRDNAIEPPVIETPPSPPPQRQTTESTTTPQVQPTLESDGASHGHVDHDQAENTESNESEDLSAGTSASQPVNLESSSPQQAPCCSQLRQFPDDHRPHSSKQRRKRHHSRHKGRSSHEKTDPQSEGQEVSLLKVLQIELQHLVNLYIRVSNVKGNLSTSFDNSLLHVLEDAQLRAEKVYSQLDSLQVPRNLRREKHDLTASAVELADNFEALIKAKRNIPNTQSEPSDISDSEGESSVSDMSRTDSNASAKHHVMLEEVKDESDF